MTSAPTIPPTPKIRGLRTPRSAYRALAAVVKGNEKRKAECYYVKDGEAHCVAAHVLVNAGVPVEWLGRVDTEGVDASGHGGAKWVADVLGLKPEVGRILARAQDTQDNGHTWGRALEDAHEYLTGLGYIA